jgi:hypothetical protein
MAMMPKLSPEVEMAHMLCITMPPVMMIVVMPRVSLGKSAERHKRSNSNYDSPH